jgi:hypothetical protein
MSIILNLLIDPQTDPNFLVVIQELSPHAIKAKLILIPMIDSLPQGVFMDFLTLWVKYHVGVFVTIENGRLVLSDSTVLLNYLVSVGTDSFIYMQGSTNDLLNFYIGSSVFNM